MNKNTAYKLGQAFRRGLAFYLGANHRSLMAMDEDRWITIHPHGKDKENDYQRIRIDADTGEITAGLGGKFNGEHISALPERGKHEQHGAKAKIQWAHLSEEERRANIERGNKDEEEKRKDKEKPEEKKQEEKKPEAKKPGYVQLWEKYDYDKLMNDEYGIDLASAEHDRIDARRDELGKIMAEKERKGECAWEERLENARLRADKAWLYMGKKPLTIVDDKAFFFADGQGKVSEIEYPEGAMSCLVVKNVEEAKETARKHVREKTDKSKREQEKIDYVKNALKTVKYEECLTPKEAENLARKLVKVEYLSYAGMGARAANEFNKALFNVLSDFPEIAQNMTVYGSHSGCAKALKGSAKNGISEEKIREKEQEYSKKFDERFEYLKESLSMKGIAQYFGLPYQEFEREEIKKRYIDKQIKQLAKDAAKRLPGANLVTRTTRNAWAWASEGGAVAFNSMTKDADFDLEYKRNVLSGYHPPTNRSGVESVMTHELGHVFMHVPDKFAGRGITAINNIHARDGKAIFTGLSKYACTNSAELCAEAFCEVRTSDNPRPLAKEVFAEMKKAYDWAVIKQNSVRKAYLG